MANDTDTAQSPPTRRRPGRPPVAAARSLFRQRPPGHAIPAGLLAFDLVTVTFFLVTTFMPVSGWILVADLVIAVGLSLEFAARLYISPRPLQYLVQPWTLVDLVVLASLLLPSLRPQPRLPAHPAGGAAGALLQRAARARDRRCPTSAATIEVIRAALNLGVFVFIVSASSSSSSATINPEINDYVDALYFTIATLTTTGFGDITLEGKYGRVLATLVMIFGISLFLNLVGAAFRPKKVEHTCPRCALLEHDVDAVYCKACGQILQIPNPGD